MTDLLKLRHLLERSNVYLLLTNDEQEDLIGSIRASRKLLEIRRAEVESQIAAKLLDCKPQGNG